MTLTIDELKDAAIAKFGSLPVVYVFEHPHPLRSINLFLIDLEKLSSEWHIEYSYIANILTAAIDGDLDIDVSPKYSFTDTRDWWLPLMPEGSHDDRPKASIKVDIR